MGAPYDYQMMNEIYGQQSPSFIHTNTTLSRFFRRYLLETAISVFEWKIPKLWARNYMLYALYAFGYIAVIDTDKFGVIPQHCGLGGYNVFYQPAYALITNTNLPLQTVAEQTGFTAYPHFSNSFRTVYGLSPAQCRKKSNSVIDIQDSGATMQAGR